MEEHDPVAGTRIRGEDHRFRAGRGGTGPAASSEPWRGDTPARELESEVREREDEGKKVDVTSLASGAA